MTRRGMAFSPLPDLPHRGPQRPPAREDYRLAIDKGIHMAYGPKKNGVVELTSLNFEKRAQFFVNSVPASPEGLGGLPARGGLGPGGALSPVGGLKRRDRGEPPHRRAVLLRGGHHYLPYCSVPGQWITLEPQELIDIAMAAEKDYVGVSVGTLDQSCEVLSRKDHLLYLDTLNDSYELIPQHPDMKPYEIAIFFSGIERNLAGSKYNMRVDEVRSAAYALKAYAGMEYGKLRRLTCGMCPGRFTTPIRTGCRRLAETGGALVQRVCPVEAGAEAWRRGDLEAYGQLSFESGRSSIENWETGSDELKTFTISCERPGGSTAGGFPGRALRAAAWR